MIKVSAEATEERRIETRKVSASRGSSVDNHEKKKKNKDRLRDLYFYA